MTASPSLISNLSAIVKDYADDDLLLIGSLLPVDAIHPANYMIDRLTASSQLSAIKHSKLAVISDLIEHQDKTSATALLGLIRHCYAGHIVLITSIEQALLQDWQLTDFLSLGFKQLAKEVDGYAIYSYNIKNYQPKHDWLNSRFWANPEQFGKHRW